MSTSSAVKMPMTGSYSTPARSEASQSSQNDYRAFDRSTAAGRMLHNLYNPRSVDSTLDRDLAKRLADQRKAREAAARPAPKPVPKSRAFVELPSPPRREFPKCLPPIGRKPLKQIESNEKERTAVARAEEERAAAARKPARTDEDKFALQYKFQFGMQPSAQILHAYHLENKGVAKKTGNGSSPQNLHGGGAFQFQPVASSVPKETKERKMWLARFDEVSAELEDRKAAMAELEQSALASGAAGAAAGAAAGPGAGNQKALIAYRERKHKLMTEMQELMRELKDCDAKLRAIDE